MDPGPRVAVHFSREVVLSGTVQLTLWMGGWRGASYDGGSGSTRLEFLPDPPRPNRLSN